MGKGNHVYNNQFKTIQKAFNDVKSHFKLLDNDLPESARIIGNIMGHRLKDKREKMMDDKEVFPDDKNSIEYGNCVKTFYESIFDWVNGVEGGENPLKVWEKLIKFGIDEKAKVNCCSVKKLKKTREKECTEMENFISGELSKMVLNFLLSLRKDLINLDYPIEYKGNESEWEDFLSKDKDK